MSTPIVQIREKRKEILLILATVIFLAAAINFGTFYLSIVFSESPILLLVLCALCFASGVLLLTRIAFGATDHTIRIRGVIAYTMKDDQLEPIRITGYQFNDDFANSYVDSYTKTKHI